MAKFHFEIGVRFRYKQEVWVIKDILTDHRVLVENLSFGGRFEKSVDELGDAHTAGDLVFEVFGRNVRQDKDEPIPTRYSFADFTELPEDVRKEAYRRYELILPLLKMPRVSRKIIQEYATTIPSVEKWTEPGKRSRVGEASSSRSIERWYRAFVESRGDLRSLVDQTKYQGGKGEKRLNGETEQVINAVLEKRAKKRSLTKSTVEDVYLEVVKRIANINSDRPQAEQIPLPSTATVGRRILSGGYVHILKRSPSRLEEQADSPVFKGPKDEYLLDIVDIDDTPMDLFVVDEEDRFPIGRPLLMWSQESSTRMPFGWYMGFAPASYSTVAMALRHGILKKPDCQALYGTKNPFPVYGMFRTLRTDRGKHYRSGHLKRSGLELGFEVEHVPVRSPWLHGQVERFLRTNNTGLLHGLPGTSLSGIYDLGDFDPRKDACISLTALNQILHLFFLDYFAQRFHEGLQDIPFRKWSEAVANGFEPMLYHDANELRLKLMPSVKRQLGRSGIEFATLIYQSADLAYLRSVLGKDAKVTIKYDPDDIGDLWVHNPEDNTWLQVPANAQDYARGLSVYKHRILRKFVLKRRGEVNIYGLADAKEKSDKLWNANL
jgi:putative transposase